MQTKLRSDAFLQQAMDTCGDAVYRLALCRLNSRADAEDVYQEVFLRLLRDDTDFRDTEHLKAWLLRVTLSRAPIFAGRRCLSAPRRWKLPADAAAPEPESSSELWQAVHALPDDQRIAVWLHYVEGYRTEEIAEMVGCRPATVRTRLHRARKQLKLDLEGSYDEEQLERTEGHQGSAGAEGAHAGSSS